MATSTSAFDVTRYLVDDATIAHYLDDCLEEGGSRLFLVAIGDVARARGMTLLAKHSGLTRAALYKALAEAGNPAFATMERVLDGLGLRLSVVAKEDDGKRAPAPRKPAPKAIARVAAKRHSQPATKTARKPPRTKKR